MPRRGLNFLAVLASRKEGTKAKTLGGVKRVRLSDERPNNLPEHASELKKRLPAQGGRVFLDGLRVEPDG